LYFVVLYELVGAVN